MESCVQGIPHSCHNQHMQLSVMVRYLDCLFGAILLHVAVIMNKINVIVTTILKQM